MRRLIFLGLCTLLGVGLLLAQGEPMSTMLQANAAYDSGDYSYAVNLYETLLRAGWHDSALYFNLGNAYYQMGDLGRALVNYLRAEQYMPRDGDLSSYLARIRAQRIDLQGDEATLLHSMVALTSGIVTLPELGWLVFILWALWFGLLVAAMLREGWREMLRVPLMVLAVVAATGIVLLASRLYTASNRPAAVVVAARAGVMTGPGEEYLEIYSLHSGAEMHVLDLRGDWVRFVLPDGRQGWLPVSSIEEV